MARPMPALAPVMMATLFDKRDMMFSIDLSSTYAVADIRPGGDETFTLYDLLETGANSGKFIQFL